MYNSYSSKQGKDKVRINLLCLCDMVYKDTSEKINLQGVFNGGGWMIKKLNKIPQSWQ